MDLSSSPVARFLISGDGLAVANPATGAHLGTVRDYRANELSAIIEEARKAQIRWAAQTAKERARVLLRWRDLVIDNAETLAQIVTAESGKPLVEARGEVAYGASFLEWFAEEGKRLYGDIIPTDAPGKRLLVLKQPIGVTAAITPWNFPIAMITRKAAPALAAGCAMIVKPAEATPFSALALETLANDAGAPKGLFRIVTTARPAEIGDALCDSPVIRKLSFTGSTRIGKRLARQCADTVKKLSLELGGNAPFIVFNDADIDAAVEGAVASKYRNAGQTCVCANRFLVHSNVHDVFVEKLSAQVGAMKVGDGAAGADIGPLITRAAVENVTRLVSDALNAGAKTLFSGPAVSESGSFFAPTIITGVTPDMALAREEIFGPVAPIIRFDDEDEAVAIANDTPYGLAAYFYAKDAARIWRVMEALEYGMVGVNEGVISTEAAPFGGVKESGIGREGSRYGIDDYVEMKYCAFGGLSK